MACLNVTCCAEAELSRIKNPITKETGRTNAFISSPYKTGVGEYKQSADGRPSQSRLWQPTQDMNTTLLS